MVYLRISENSEQAKVFLDFVKTMPFVELIGEENVPNDLTMKSFDEHKNGKVTKAKNVVELMSKLEK